MVNPRSALLFSVLAAGVAYQPSSKTVPLRTDAMVRSSAQSYRAVTYDKDLEVRNWPLETIYQSFVNRTLAGKAAKELDCSQVRACGVDVIIATVPDPQNSQYPSLFDEFMQSIQRAFGDSGYNLDQFWLPWNAEPEPVDADFILRTQHKEWLTKVQANPGVLVFRNSGSRICVLLVGENPINGVNKLQFSNAIGIVKSLKHKEETPLSGVLGPTFSGSAESLLRLMSELSDENHSLQSIPVISGSATAASVSDEAKSFGRTIGKTIGSDQTAFELFLTYAARKTSPDHIAILVESGTAYSQEISNFTRSKIKRFEYPMQISRLRNAYGKDPELGAVSQSKDGTPHQSLEIQLKDDHGSEDRIPSFSAELSPVSQEATVLSTLADIDRLHISYLGIVASDILDSVFLGRLLKLHCPNTRTFFLDSDLIYSHTAQSNAFDGALLATNYPLFRKPNQTVERRFSSAAGEGVYHAAAQLILKINPNAQGEEEFRDAPWLAVVGRDGIWPIQEPAGKPSDLILVNASLGWWITFYLVSAFCLAFGGALLYVNWKCKNDCVPLGWLSALQISNGTAAPLRLTLLLLIVFYAFTAWLQLSLPLPVGFGVCLPTLTVLLAALARCWGEISIRKVLAAEILAAMACFLLSLHPAESAPFFYRSLHVGNGVSPVVPSALLAIALFWLCWTNLNRIRLMHLFPRRFPSLKRDIFLSGTRRLHVNLRFILGHWAAGTWKTACILGGVLLFSVVLVNPTAIYSLETFHFEWIYAVGLYGLYFGLLIECTRFLRAWWTLESLLKMLERHALCDAFRRLPNELSPALLWRWGGGGHPFLVLAHFWSRLNELSGRLSRAVFPGHEAPFSSQVHIVGKCSQSLMGSVAALRMVPFATVSILDRNLTAVLAQLMDSMCEVWGTGRQVQWKLVMAAGAGGRVHGHFMKANAAMAEDVHELAEEIIALRFVQLIAQVNLQMKNSLEFIAGALILAVISLNSYPFEPHHSLTSMLTIYFFGMSTTFLLVFMRMSRNTIVSYLSNTDPGKLDGNLFHIVSFGGLPLLAVISSQFPTVGGFLFAWVKPALETLR